MELGRWGRRLLLTYRVDVDCRRGDRAWQGAPRLSYSLSLRAREAERRQQGRSSCSTCASRRCGAAPLAGAGVFDLAKLVVAIQGDDGAIASCSSSAYKESASKRTSTRQRLD